MKKLSSSDTILIVGGSGFLGTACLEVLSNYNLISVGKKSFLDLNRKRLEHLQLDISNSKQVEKFISKHDFSHLLYLAWPPTPPHNSLDNSKFAVSSICFIKLFAEHNPGARIVCVGSIHETGVKKGIITNDYYQLLPESLYGLSKKFLLDSLYLKQIKNLCWIRLSNVYGVGDHDNKILSRMIHTNINQEIIQLNNPNAAIDFVHIKDAAIGICRALTADYQGIINIGGGKGYYLKDLYKFIKKYIANNKIHKINFVLRPKLGAVLDISKAKEILAYVPSVSIEEGFVQACIAYKNKT